MAKKHGAKQQKKEAKKKAKRAEKRSQLAKRTSTDPTVRLRGVGDWPVHEAWMAASLWEQGLGYLLISRHEPKGGLVYASYLVDVYCLGVKNALWDAGTKGDFKEMLKNMEASQPMEPISPACLAKIVRGSLEYAASMGFRPHPDFRHAGLLLAGIDPAECAEEFSFGKDGKPFYIRGPYETPAQAQVIGERIKAAGGEYVVPMRPIEMGEALDLDDVDFDDDDDFDDEEEEGYDPLGLPER